MKSPHFVRWSWSDPLSYLTALAWGGLFASYLFASVFADALEFDAVRALAHLLAFGLGLGSWSWAWASLTRGSRTWAIAAAATPWLAIAVAAAFVRGLDGAGLSLSAGLGALASTSLIGPSTLTYWLLLALGSAHYARHPTLGTLLVLVGVAAVSALGLIESNSRAVLERFLARRDPAHAGNAWRRRTSRLAPSSALLTAGLMLALVLAVTRAVAFYRDALGEDGQRNAAASGAPRSAEGESVAQWMQSVSMGSAAAERTDEVLAIVALRSARDGTPVRDGRTLYFHVTTLDQFGADRMSRSARGASVRIEDRDDGEDDGWIELARPRAGAPLVTATVTQFGAVTARGGLAPLVRLEPLLAVRIEALSRLEDGTLLAPVRDDRLEYALAADPRVAKLPADHRGRAWHRDRRYLELPRSDPALARIEQRAREVARGANTDAERALAMVAHFREGYTYSEEGTGAAGCEGLARLLERRSGYCATIAAACVLMLRSEGIPARAVAGLLGSEFDPQLEHYVLRQRHGHAWVEAHFDGLGWVQLDPTPPDVRSSTSAPREIDPLAEWSEQARADLAAFARGDGDAPGIAEIASVLSQGPAAFVNSARGGSPATIAAAVVLLAGVAWLLVRQLRRAVLSFQSAHSSPGRALALETRLIAALRARGAHVAASRTLREIAASAAARIEAPLVPALRSAIRALEAARFGGHELDRERRRELEELLEQLRAN